tara:strand:- start:7807 stop:8184 length:378 start_codon:yes stop_codon:yes gene_type:complete
MAFSKSLGGELVKAGQLDTRVEVYTLTSTQNDYGEYIDTFSLFGKVWCAILPVKGIEKVQDDTIVATKYLTILVRKASWLNLTSGQKAGTTMRIKYLDKFWEITSNEYYGRGKGVVLTLYWNDNA